MNVLWVVQPANSQSSTPHNVSYDVVIKMKQRRKNFILTAMCHECVNVTQIVTRTYLRLAVWITVHKMSINVPGSTSTSDPGFEDGMN